MSSCVTCGRVHLDPHTEDYDPSPDDPCKCGHPLSDHEGEGDFKCLECPSMDQVCRGFEPDFSKERKVEDEPENWLL